MMRTYGILMGVLMTVTAVGDIAPDPRPVPRPPISRPATQPVLPAITYVRTGGFAGTQDRITISPDGKVVAGGKMMRAYTAVLTREQVADLAKLVADWGTLADEYRPDPRMRDGFGYEITCGTKTVRTSDGAPGVPDLFGQVRARLEELGRAPERK